MKRSSPTWTTASMCRTRRATTRASTCSSSGTTCGHASGCWPAWFRIFRRKATTARFAIGAEEIVLVRQADGGIKAFYNVCPHRGNKLALNDRGSVAQVHLRVPRLAVPHERPPECITDEHTFAPELVSHRPSMSEVRCDVVGGIIFMNMDGKAPPLREALGVPPEYIESYGIEHMHVVHHVRTEWARQLEDRRRCVLRNVSPAARAPADADRHGGFQPVRPLPERWQPHDRATLHEVASRRTTRSRSMRACGT